MCSVFPDAFPEVIGFVASKGTCVLFSVFAMLLIIVDADNAPIKGEIATAFPRDSVPQRPVLSRHSDHACCLCFATSCSAAATRAMIFFGNQTFKFNKSLK